MRMSDWSSDVCSSELQSQVKAWYAAFKQSGRGSYETWEWDRHPVAKVLHLHRPDLVQLFVNAIVPTSLASPSVGDLEDEDFLRKVEEESDVTASASRSTSSTAASRKRPRRPLPDSDADPVIQNHANATRELAHAIRDRKSDV